MLETRNLASFSLPAPWSVISTQALFQSGGRPGDRQLKMLSINLLSMAIGAAGVAALEGAASATSWRGAAAGAAGRAGSGRTTGCRAMGARRAEAPTAGAAIGATARPGGRGGRATPCG